MVEYETNSGKSSCDKIIDNFEDSIVEIWTRTLNPEGEFGDEHGFTAINVTEIEKVEERPFWGKITSKGWHRSDIINGSLGEIRLPKLPGTVRVDDVIRIHTHPPDSLIGHGVSAFSIGDMISYLMFRRAGWTICLVGRPDGKPNLVEIRCIEKKGGHLDEEEADRIKEEVKSVFREKSKEMGAIKASDKTLEEILGPISKFCRKDITNIAEGTQR